MTVAALHLAILPYPVRRGVSSPIGGRAGHRLGTFLYATSVLPAILRTLLQRLLPQGTICIERLTGGVTSLAVLLSVL